MVQDLRAINEAVIPFHLIVSNPYTVLTQVPSNAKWFAVLDLKDAFSASCFTLTANHRLPLNGQILTLIELPSRLDYPSTGFQDSPHLFGQALG